MHRVILPAFVSLAVLSLIVCTGTSCSPQTPGGGSYLYECPSTGYQDGAAFIAEVRQTGSFDNMNAYWRGAPYDAYVWEMAPSCHQYHDDWERGFNENAYR